MEVFHAHVSPWKKSEKEIHSYIDAEVVGYSIDQQGSPSEPAKPTASIDQHGPTALTDLKTIWVAD